MVAKHRLATDPEAVEKVEAALAVILPFPSRQKDASQSRQPDIKAEREPMAMSAAPEHGERPTLLTPVLREWLRVALIVSVAVHAIVFLAFQMRFEDDLERAAGAAAARSSEGTVTIPVEVVVEAMLPSASSPTDATEAEAETPEPAPPQTEVLEETQPEPTIEEVQERIPLPPEPEPVILPTQEEARRLALPEEESAPPAPVETAETPEAPTMVLEEEPPLPMPREPVKPAPKKLKQAGEVRKKQKSARSKPSTAASPSRAAGANANASAGAGGAAATGGRAAISSYQAQVLAHLSRQRVYPPEARSRGVTGVARVRFALGRDGRVLSVSLAGGSGERILDQAALEMVRRASPFPPFPAGLTQARMNFGAPIRFDLR